MTEYSPIAMHLRKAFSAMPVLPSLSDTLPKLRWRDHRIGRQLGRPFQDRAGFLVLAHAFVGKRQLVVGVDVVAVVGDHALEDLARLLELAVGHADLGQAGARPLVFALLPARARRLRAPCPARRFSASGWPSCAAGRSRAHD
jgi:hypothetical protein